MFTITLIFAVLVALWGFSSVIASYAKRALGRAKQRAQTAPAREAAPQAHRSRPVASA